MIIASAAFFVLVIGLVFWHERRRWKTYSTAREQVETESAKLLEHATVSYQKKFGRAPSVLDEVTPAVTAKR